MDRWFDGSIDRWFDGSLVRCSLLRRGLLQSRLGKKAPAARGGWEEGKLERAGNAGKGKERKEASARFSAVLWQDLRFCGFG